jgi:hypothetical protein
MVAVKASCQELSLLGGTTTSGVFQKSTYGWEADYRQNLYRYLAGSVSYINEGHFPGHYRDGTGYELWLSLPVLDGRFTLSGGAGAYYYYDTQPAGGGSVDVHGTAPILSLAATGYLNDNWFYRVMLNRITPSADTKDTTVLAGVGYWFGPNRRPKGSEPNAEAPEPGYVTEPQLTFFGGQTVVNTLYNSKAWAGAVEYRQGVLAHVDATATGIYEGNPESERRSGFAAQLWAVNTFQTSDTTVGIGLGPYVYIDRRHPVGATRVSPAAVAPLLALTVARRVSDNWIARFVWDRVTTTYNRDADIFLVGLGYGWR